MFSKQRNKMNREAGPRAFSQTFDCSPTARHHPIGLYIGPIRPISLIYRHRGYGPFTFASHRRQSPRVPAFILMFSHPHPRIPQGRSIYTSSSSGCPNPNGCPRSGIRNLKFGIGQPVWRRKSTKRNDPSRKWNHATTMTSHHECARTKKESGLAPALF